MQIAADARTSQCRGRSAGAAPADRRHLSYRRYPGPSRARLDALGCARSGARLRAVPRKARRSARSGIGAEKSRSPARAARRRGRRATPARPGSPARIDHVGLRGPGRGGRSQADPRRNPEESLRRRARRRGAQVRGAFGARPDRKGPCLSARRWTRRATSSSGTSACRRCTTAISCTCTARASSCRRRFSCGSRWAWR